MNALKNFLGSIFQFDCLFKTTLIVVLIILTIGISEALNAYINQDVYRETPALRELRQSQSAYYRELTRKFELENKLLEQNLISRGLLPDESGSLQQPGTYLGTH